MSAKKTPGHTPVLLEETLTALAVQPGGRYIDCTVGGGGHAAAILKRSEPGGQLLGIDADPNAIEAARWKLKDAHGSYLLVNENFANLEAVAIKHDFHPVHGILFDLGLSSLQLNGSGRGFSFQHDASLDMRFNPEQEVTAADIINTYSESKLSDLIRVYGEESHSHHIARYIIKERPIKSTLHLARTIEQAKGRRGRIHPATRTFQAMRIAVNHELENLEKALEQAIGILGLEGRLVVISYHSLEDRIVKQFMQREAKGCICPPETPACICQHVRSLRIINRKVITPSPEEIVRNPRSRSARLRAAERTTNSNDCYKPLETLPFLAETGCWKKPVILSRLRKNL
jgi:16S rRNA (cytosine1402-N4)-methyltransferase